MIDARVSLCVAHCSSQAEYFDKISVAKMHEISLMSISNINNFPHIRGGNQGEDWGGRRKRGNVRDSGRMGCAGGEGEGKKQ